MRDIWQWLLGKGPMQLDGKGELAFRFVAEYSDYLKLAMIAGFVVLVVLTIRSYRREGEAPRKVKAVLAALRIAAFTLILAILLEPALVLRMKETLFSSVAFVIDDSASMENSDRYMEEAQEQRRAALANFLGIGSEELPNLSRTEIVRRALDRPGVIGRLTKDHPVMLLGFSTPRPGKDPYTRSLGEIDQPSPEPEANKQPTSAPAPLAEMLSKLDADGLETNYAVALRDTLEKLRGRTLSAVVFIGDGQNTTEGAHRRLARASAYAAQRGVPLYAVSVGDPTPPKDVAVTALEAPDEVRGGASIEMTARLAFRNAAGRRVTVTLTRRAPGDAPGDANTVATREVTLTGEQDKVKGVMAVTLPVEVDAEEGERLYRVAVESGLEEPNRKNNHAERVLKVSGSRIKVLLVSGDSGTEYRFLSSYFLRQQDLYRVSIWQQNLDEDLEQFGSEGMKLAKLPDTKQELMGVIGDPEHPGYDVVVLYDPQPTVGGFDEKFVEMLFQFVNDHGGGLCYIVGNKYTERTLLATKGYDPLAHLLPVTISPNIMEAVRRISEGAPTAWEVRLSSYGKEHPVMRLGGTTGEETADVWSYMPGIYWSHAVARIKPGVRVLAENTDPMRKTHKDEPEPLIAAGVVGNGRVLYMGFDETWRWRAVNDAEFYRQFWTNAMRYLALSKGKRVVITAGANRFALGEKITIEATVYDEEYNLLRLKPGQTYTIQRVDDDSGKVRNVELKPVVGPDGEVRPGRFKITLTAERRGRFTLTAMRDDPHHAEKVQSKQIAIEAPQAEAMRTEADEQALQQLASKPGRFAPIHRIESLIERIPADRRIATEEVFAKLWDTPLMLLVIVLLLVVEWIGRKTYNMA